MIEKLILKNFQCYKKRTIRFDKITTIVGPSDSGKSAIVRALRWVLLNRPAGMAFIRRGADRCKAQVTTEDNAIIRERSKSQNVYKTRDGEYKAFGNNVPQPIIETANVCEDNFQKQHDSPYWLNMSPGEVSRALNEVVDLEIIDRTLSNLNRELRSSKSTVEVSRARLSEAKDERKRLDFVLEMDADLTRWETASQKYKDQRGDIERLGGLIDTAKEALASKSESERNLSKAEKHFDATEYVYQEYQRTEHDKDSLINMLEDCQTWKEELETVITKLEKAESELSEFDTCPWCGSEL